MAKDLAQIFIRAVDQSKDAFDSLKKNTREAGDGLQRVNGMLAGLGAGVSVGAFALLVKQSIDAQAALDDLQETTALTVETLSSLQQTARIGGHSFEMVTGMASKFAKSVAEAAGGNKELLRSFDALGISQERLRTGKFDDLYTEFAAKIAGAENKTYAIAYATDLAGKSAAQALPFFKDLAETGLLWPLVSTEQAAAADKLQKQFGRLGNEFDTLKNQLASEMVPGLLQFTAELNIATEATGDLFRALQAMDGLSDWGATAAEQVRNLNKEIQRLETPSYLTELLQPEWMRVGRANNLRYKRDVAQRMLERTQIGATNAGGLDGAAGDAPFRPPPPPSKPGSPDTAGPQLIAQLTNQLGELNGEGSEVDKVIRKLTDGTHKYSLEVQASALAIAGEIDELKRAKTAREAYVKAMEMDEQVMEEIAQLRVKESDAMAKANVAAYESIERINIEVELMGLSNAERERRIALIELEKSKQQLSPEQYARYRGELNTAYDRKAAAEGYQKFIDDAKRMNESVGESLTDSLLRGFENGKDIAENFRDSLKNLFSTLVLRPIVQPVAQGMAGVVTGALGSLGMPGYANASGMGMGDVGNLLNQGSSLLGVGGAGFWSGFGTTAGMGAAEAAALIESGTVGMAGLGMEAGALGIGATGSFGAAAMSAVPYVGLALMAASMLRSKKTPAVLTGVDATGTVSRSGFDNQSWFGNDANQGYRWSTHDHGSTSYFNTAIAGLFDDIEGVARKLGLDTSALNTASVSFSASGLQGGGPQQIAEQLTANLGQVSDQLANLLMPNLREFAQANESATQTLVRLVTVQEQLLSAEEQQKTQLSNAIRGLPGQLGITGLQGARDSLSVSDYVSPLSRLTSARGLLDATFNSAMGGDLASINSFPQVLQQALQIGRDVGASGPAFQSLFLEGNRQLNQLLEKQQGIQQELMQGIDLSIIQASQDQIAELKRGFGAMVTQLDQVTAELRRIREAA